MDYCRIVRKKPDLIYACDPSFLEEDYPILNEQRAGNLLGKKDSMLLLEDTGLVKLLDESELKKIKKEQPIIVSFNIKLRDRSIYEVIADEITGRYPAFVEGRYPFEGYNNGEHANAYEIVGAEFEKILQALQTGTPLKGAELMVQFYKIPEQKVPQTILKKNRDNALEDHWTWGSSHFSRQS